MVGLEEYRHRKLGRFSGGMKQRILIAQALLGDPKVIILDEPAAGLDPKERIRIRNFISQIAEDKIILIATHVVSDVSSIAKEIILLGNGKILFQDSPEHLCRKLESRVIECITDFKEVEKFLKHFIVSNVQEISDQKVKLRIVLKEDDPYPEGYSLIDPDLQDVYLSVFQQSETENLPTNGRVGR